MLIALLLAVPAKALSGEVERCFVLMDIESGKVVRDLNPALCSKRTWPCSSFKIPLAVMGFDSEVLQGVTTVFKWDGHKQLLKAWEKDHDARSWLRDSVVWYSQRLTPQIGLRKIQKYLQDFRYGNKDFSGGITKAWLSSSLKVSPREQATFLRRLARRELRTSDKAVDLALSIVPVEVEAADLKIAGKTGSCFSWQARGPQRQPPFRVGWYVGYATLHATTYAFASLVKAPSEKGKLEFSGAEAKAFAIEQLKEVR